MSQVTLLYQLQQLDDLIRNKKGRLTTVIQGMNEPEALLQARETAEATAQMIADLQVRQRDLELRASSLLEKYEASHDRMYSGKVVNSRELSALHLEVESLQGRRTKLDDVLLENMVELEEKNKTLQSTETTLTALDNQWQQTYTALNNEKLALATELTQLLGERKALVGKIDPKNLIAYTNIAKKWRGLAVVKLQHTQCEGCRTRVAVSTAKAVGQGAITYCGNCDRILISP